MTNNTEKKNNNSKIIAILAILLIAVLSFGIWAWSKYTNSYSGKSASTVAKWNFTTDKTKIANIDLAKAVDGVVVCNQMILYSCHLDEPRLSCIVNKRSVTAPAERIIMLKLRSIK